MEKVKDILTKTLPLLLFIISLAGNADSQVLPVYTDAAHYTNDLHEYVLMEEFDDNSSNWALGTSSLARADLGRGRFVFQGFGNGTQWPYNYIGGVPLDLSRDYRIKTDITLIGGTFDYAYYFMWGEDLNNRHNLGFKHNGSINYEVCHNGQWTTPFLKEGGKGAANYAGVTWNLDIRKKGDSIALYINDWHYATVPYINVATKPVSLVGFIVNKEIKIEIGSIHVLQNRKMDPAADSAYFLTYKQRAEEGDTAAMFQLANMYWQGAGVKRDSLAALHTYELAAEKGHLLSMANAGFAARQLYASGKNIYKDIAAKWYREASEQNTTMSGYYFSQYVSVLYPYVDRFDHRYYSFQNLPESKEIYFAKKEAERKTKEKVNENAHFNQLPKMTLRKVSIDRMNKNNCYIADNTRTVALLEVSPAQIQPRDYYWDFAKKTFVMHLPGATLDSWAGKQPVLYVARGCQVEMDWTERTCKKCSGKGSLGGGYGSRIVSIPTGTSTVTRTQTIVGQTEKVTITPNYTTTTVTGYAPPVKCQECDGQGKFPPVLATVISIN